MWLTYSEIAPFHRPPVGEMETSLLMICPEEIAEQRVFLLSENYKLYPVHLARILPPKQMI